MAASSFSHANATLMHLLRRSFCSLRSTRSYLSNCISANLRDNLSCGGGGGQMSAEHSLYSIGCDTAQATLMREKHRDRRTQEHASCRAAEDKLAKTRMTISTHH